jgi:hypothetical protein
MNLTSRESCVVLEKQEISINTSVESVDIFEGILTMKQS